MDQPGTVIFEVANSARGQLNRGKIIFRCPRSCLRIRSRDTKLRPSRPVSASSFFSTLRLNLVRFGFFVFCFLVPLRGTENLHKSNHLQSILLGMQRPLLTHTPKNKALASDTTKP